MTEPTFPPIEGQARWTAPAAQSVGTTANLRGQPTERRARWIAWRQAVLDGLIDAKDLIVGKASIFWMRRRLARLTRAVGEVVLSRGVAIPGTEGQVADAQSLQQQIQTANEQAKQASRALRQNKAGLATVGCVALLVCLAGWLVLGGLPGGHDTWSTAGSDRTKNADGSPQSRNTSTEDQRTLGDFIQHAKQCRVNYPFIYAEDESVVFNRTGSLSGSMGALWHQSYDIRVFRFPSTAEAIESCKRSEGLIRKGLWVMYVGPRAELSQELKRAFEEW